MSEGSPSAGSVSVGTPLAGKWVVNTRAFPQAGQLDLVLVEYGAVPLSFPCIATRPPADVGALDAAVGRLTESGFDWIVFTSVNTAEAVAGRSDAPAADEGSGGPSAADASVAKGASSSVRAAVEPVGRRTREPVKGSPTGTVGSHQPPLGCLPERSEGSWRSLSAKVAVVGRVTGEAVERLLGWPVAFIPAVERAADLGRTLPIAPGDRVLLPKSALAGPELAAILSGRGAAVTEVVAYETVVGAGGVALAPLLAAGEVDAVCFTSGSTVRGFLDRLGSPVLPDAVRVACIGTETAGVARALGLRVDVVPDRPTARAMVAALAASFTGDRA